MRILRITPLLSLVALAACNAPSPPASTLCSEVKIPSAPAGAITIDGDAADWAAAGLKPLLTRAPGTPAKSGALRIDAFYAAVVAGKLLLRFDGALPDTGLTSSTTGSTPELRVFVKALGGRSAQLTFRPSYGESGCGHATQGCCKHHTCFDGGCCNRNNTCAAKGGPCGEGLDSVCQDGACGSCGAAGGACCETPSTGQIFCTAAWQTCGEGKTCTHCGGEGEPCCDGGCGEGFACSGTLCTRAPLAEQGCNCDRTGTCGGEQGWRCSGNWNTNTNNGPSEQNLIAGGVAGIASGTTFFVEGWTATKDFSSTISLYPYTGRTNTCQGDDCQDPPPEDEIGCVWTAWDASSSGSRDARAAER